jgi:hypothetical protein
MVRGGDREAWLGASAAPTTTPPPSRLLLCVWGATTTSCATPWPGATAPVAVAGYTYSSLPAEVRELVPAAEQLDTALAATAHPVDR